MDTTRRDELTAQNSFTGGLTAGCPKYQERVGEVGLK